MAEILVASEALHKVKKALGDFKEGIGNFGTQAAQQCAICEEECRAVIRKTEGTIRMIEGKCDQLRAEIQQTESNIAHANEQRKALFDSIHQLEGQWQELENQKSALRAMRDDSENPLSSEMVEAEIDMIDEQIRNVKTDIEDKKQAREQLKKEVLAMERTLHGKENELSIEKIRLNKYKQKLYRLQTEARHVQNDFDSYVAKAEKFVSDASGSADAKRNTLDCCISLVEEMENWSV